MKLKMIKILGFGATAIGALATLVSGYVDDVKMESLIEKNVNEHFESLENDSEIAEEENEEVES